MADVMDRLRKLLAMAESPVDEEARTAALLAVRLIKEHKIELALPGNKPPAAAGAPPPPTPRATGAPWPPPNPFRNDPFREPTPPPPPPPPATRAYRFGGPPVRLFAKFAGACAHCNRSFARDAEVFWMRRHGTTHVTCVEYWFKP